MTPQVSVIMPVWQPREAWLRRAVAHALDEPDLDLELLIVDDGCEPPVAGVLGELADDPRVRVLRVTHRGPYATRNAALAVARGAYVRFADADDVSEPGSTGRLLAVAQAAGGETIAYGATLMCDEDLTPQRVVEDDVEGDAVEACLLGGFDVFIVAMLFPRAVLERAGPFEERAFEVSGDWDYVLRALEQAPVRRLDEVVARYRRHPASVTRGAGIAAGARAGRLVLDRYFARHPDRRGTAFERRAYSELHVERAEAHAARREWAAALGQLAAAARRDPRAGLSATRGWVAERVRIRARRARRRPA
jgi:glycosyltransferase involved in cell wall biosynthesis